MNNYVGTRSKPVMITLNYLNAYLLELKFKGPILETIFNFLNLYIQDSVDAGLWPGQLDCVGTQDP